MSFECGLCEVTISAELFDECTEADCPHRKRRRPKDLRGVPLAEMTYSEMVTVYREDEPSNPEADTLQRAEG